jgi:hypothetical protein
MSPLWPGDSPAVIAHLTLLQGIINRLATNSASCKTWCLALVGALVGVAGAVHAPGMVAFTIVPITIFGFMDSMYLAQEAAYRNVYARAVERIHSRSYTLQDMYSAGAPSALQYLGSALCSWSIVPVYGGLIAAYAVAYRADWLGVLAATGK